MPYVRILKIDLKACDGKNDKGEEIQTSQNLPQFEYCGVQKVTSLFPEEGLTLSGTWFIITFTNRVEPGACN